MKLKIVKDLVDLKFVRRIIIEIQSRGRFDKDGEEIKFRLISVAISIYLKTMSGRFGLR